MNCLSQKIYISKLEYYLENFFFLPAIRWIFILEILPGFLQDWRLSVRGRILKFPPICLNDYSKNYLKNLET